MLGLTKPLSDHLQGKELDLSCTIDLVEFVTKTLKEYRSDRHFSSHVWQRATELALERNIDICIPDSQKQSSRLPAKLNDGVVLASIG